MVEHVYTEMDREGGGENDTAREAAKEETRMRLLRFFQIATLRNAGPQACSTMLKYLSTCRHKIIIEALIIFQHLYELSFHAEPCIKGSAACTIPQLYTAVTRGNR